MGERSVELPGLGTKFELETEKGDKIAIVFLNSGHNQLYLQEKGKDLPQVANLSPTEARRLGSVLTGAVIEAEKEAVEIGFSALSDMRIRVHTYLARKNLAGKRIGDLQVRTRSGATVIAVSRKGKNVINPPPSFTFEEGDILVIIGESEHLRVFEKEILGI
ncbi:MAG: potassium transporter TrkA [Methanomicrobiales archaeon]|nr:potassium transporter TrkA [Methanomicrobiales archaeon]